jgi:hypothetical protein
MFVRSRWPNEVKQGYDFYDESGRTDLAVPPLEGVIAYYQQRATEVVSPPPEDPPDSAVG